MFAVSGWNVTAPLKTQAAGKSTAGKHASQQPQPSHEAGHTKTPQGQQRDTPKKRKRTREQGAEHVTNDNVQDLWQSVIEGRKPKRIRTKKSKQRAEKVGDGIPASNGAASEDTAQVPTPNATGKDKKQPKKSKKEAKGGSEVASSTLNTSKTISKPDTKLTPLQASMRAKLSSARFRHLNEQLYTTPSSTAFALFKETPEMFKEYHSGFRQQVEVWPENPVDGYIQELRTRGVLRRFNSNAVSADTSSWNSTPLPRTRSTCTIADIGCGDARLSSTLQSKAQKLNLKILSFDLYSPSPLVTTADAANLPVPNGTVDIAIFCLALMGTNWLDFIDESWRILRPNGELWIAEIKSRFTRGSGSGSCGTSGPSSAILTSNSAAKQSHSRGTGYTKGGIGTLRQNVPTLSKRDRERQQAADEVELVAKIDVPDATGKPATASASLKSSSSSDKTDVSAFITALRRHGFALAGTERDAVDTRNRMFVKLRFVKAAQPVLGRNARAAGDGDGVLGDEQRGGRRVGDRVARKKKMRFLEGGDAVDEVVDEGRILKPCVYKLR